jgi:uncharacterized protein (DUF2147 family)
MKKLFVAAALLMATTSAHAGNSISFEIQGHKIHIEAPKDCNTLSCLKVSAPGLSGSGLDFKGFTSKRFDDGDDVAQQSDPAPQTTAPAPAAQAAAPQPVAPVASTQAPASTAVASNAMPAVGFETPSASAVASPAASQPAPVAPVAAPTTPLGIWATEEGKGNVRVEPCGPNLCGYAVKTGEKILINMKPQDSKWTGQIHDPDSDRNYDSTIAMKGPNSLRVQGCAFGGMFCGGQTWKRIS